MNNPVVTIGVITYNSAKTVIETLESIKKQSYLNIELLISDDCSKDNTTAVCRDWLMKNGDNFVYFAVLESKENKGVPHNCNKVIDNAQGVWIKIIAGDDTLDKDCIQNNLSFAEKHTEAKIFFSKSRNFKSFTGETVGYRPGDGYILPDAQEKQFEAFLIKDYVNPTTVFCHKSVYDAVGRYDERYKAMEDSPMWFRVFKRGFKFYYMDIVTVNYRISDTSLSNSKKRGKPNQFWVQSKADFFNDNVKEELICRGYHQYARLQSINYRLMFALATTNNLLFYCLIKIILKINNYAIILIVKKHHNG